MAQAPAKLTGPDFTRGFRLTDLKDGSMLLGHALGEAILLVRRGQQAFAVSAFCTHYGAPLADGIVTGNQIRCPWHHACFDLTSGAPISPPALNGLGLWKTEDKNGLISVISKIEAPAERFLVSQETPFVVIGTGAAGLVAAETLRREGFDGRIVMIGEDEDPPYDRPNLSKDYLAGTAPEEWIPLRAPEFYAERGIELIAGVSAQSIDPEKRSVVLNTGEEIGFEKLLLATGARPVRLPIPGAELPHVHYLRSLADSRVLSNAARTARSAVVIGSSFIGLEVAASLRSRGVEVTVVGKESIPFERTLGIELGTFIQALHESRGVRFRLNQTPERISENEVRLADGSSLRADLVVIGVGVTPATEIAERSGIETQRGILVNRNLETSCAGIFAAGDVARYPDPISGEPIRVEHWVLAQRQGKAAALNMLGRNQPFAGVPFFWSNHYDLTIGFTGYAAPGSERVVVGSLEERDCLIAYRNNGKFSAVATVGRDRDALMIEEALERGMTEAIERIVKQSTTAQEGERRNASSHAS